MPSCLHSSIHSFIHSSILPVNGITIMQLMLGAAGSREKNGKLGQSVVESSKSIRIEVFG